MLPVLSHPQHKLLKTTTSVCPVCRAPLSAEVSESEAGITLSKTCPTHGRFDVQLAPDRERYYLSHGNNAPSCGPTCGCAPHADPSSSRAPQSDSAKRDPFETLSTCIALIEIVDSCNLACPTCYSSSPLDPNGHVDHLPLDDFIARVNGVLDRKGAIDILQLSGGEPTLHPRFFDILRYAVQQPRIGYVLINTNAVRIARDSTFRAELCEFRRSAGKFELYVQFDGPQIDAQFELRGADLRNVRQTAIDLAGAAGVPSTLAMTVTRGNLSFLGDTLRFGLERPHVRGVTFQPRFRSGRVDEPAQPSLVTRTPLLATAPISVAEIVTNVVSQSRDLLSEADFTPLPCGDPNCHTIGYLLRTPSGPLGLSRLVDLRSMQSFLQNRVDYRLEDLARCGCESEPLGDAIRSLELSAQQPFRIFIKPFMDAWTFDQDRIDRCCTHVIRPDGRLDSFCRYYLHGGAAQFKRAARNSSDTACASG